MLFSPQKRPREQQRFPGRMLRIRAWHGTAWQFLRQQRLGSFPGEAAFPLCLGSCLLFRNRLRWKMPNKKAAIFHFQPLLVSPEQRERLGEREPLGCGMRVPPCAPGFKRPPSSWLSCRLLPASHLNTEDGLGGAAIRTWLCRGDVEAGPCLRDGFPAGLAGLKGGILLEPCTRVFLDTEFQVISSDCQCRVGRISQESAQAEVPGRGLHLGFDPSSVPGLLPSLQLAASPPAPARLPLWSFPPASWWSRRLPTCSRLLPAGAQGLTLHQAWAGRSRGTGASRGDGRVIPLPARAGMGPLRPSSGSLV